MISLPHVITYWRWGGCSNSAKGNAIITSKRRPCRLICIQKIWGLSSFTPRHQQCQSSHSACCRRHSRLGNQAKRVVVYLLAHRIFVFGTQLREFSKHLVIDHELGRTPPESHRRIHKHRWCQRSQCRRHTIQKELIENGTESRTLKLSRARAKSQEGDGQK